MTTYSFCTAPLLALSFRPTTTGARPRNERRPIPSVGALPEGACSKQRVLGALYRLSREAEPATLQRLALVIGLADARDLVAPLARLAADGMVQKRGTVLSLSLVGFAAAAALATAGRARSATSPRNPRRSSQA